MGEELFYTVPARYLTAGVSTCDGHEVDAVAWWGDRVVVTLAQRDGSALLHPARRREPETRVYLLQHVVELCVFDDTALDLSAHPYAGNWRRWDGSCQRWVATGCARGSAQLR